MTPDEHSTRVAQAVRRYAYPALYAFGVVLVGVWIAADWLQFAVGDDVAIHGLIILVFVGQLMNRGTDA